MIHTRWKLARERQTQSHVEPPEVVAEREQIRLAHALGQLVYDRRTALGLSQSVLGERLGLTVDEVEAVELGGMLPVTADLLVRLAGALDVTVDLHVVAEGGNTVAFGNRAA
ncbi:helix-turn-helix domain-containing protein [Streptomyces sp. RY43-2]|uniref:Helix-turn-helix domain-containing protein n=1 Tax=Streptomyces macrolidinus TaxID=2952607 RepID=A0ABT0ZLH6_9ACTN|nr:helix-turn-helix domain-containing protein [Streptomyces macrolidinus]MCN9244445.1 helix-turn-helix domain-containing protein [Streptomyces macrolidinus]